MTDLLDDNAAKYIVSKVDDGSLVDDAVVIRLKDPFAATALFTYCNTIMSFLELMEDTMDEGEHQRMLDVADYFHQQACESQKIKGKRLPD
jgi:hypothetical protein